jgi:hypothetical protein
VLLVNLKVEEKLGKYTATLITGQREETNQEKSDSLFLIFM